MKGQRILGKAAPPAQCSGKLNNRNVFDMAKALNWKKGEEGGFEWLESGCGNGQMIDGKRL